MKNIMRNDIYWSGQAAVRGYKPLDDFLKDIKSKGLFTKATEDEVAVFDYLLDGAEAINNDLL
jgi:hypothetical protein